MRGRWDNYEHGAGEQRSWHCSMARINRTIAALSQISLAVSHPSGTYKLLDQADGITGDTGGAMISIDYVHVASKTLYIINIITPTLGRC